MPWIDPRDPRYRGYMNEGEKRWLEQKYYEEQRAAAMRQNLATNRIDPYIAMMPSLSDNKEDLTKRELILLL